MRISARQLFRRALLVAILIGLAGVLVYFLPPVKERVDYRLTLWSAQLKYALYPPEKVSFVPQEQPAQDPPVAATRNGTGSPLLENPTATTAVQENASSQPTSTGEATPIPSPTPTITSTPLPESVILEGISYFDQHGAWNYCGPATLAMGLSYWGWGGNRYDTGGYLRGGLDRVDDKNVMPYEMQNYVSDETDLGLIVRLGGNLALMKRLIAEGFPVIVEKGFELEGIGWMGHYLLLSGYDESRGEFISQDSYRGADMRYSYAEVLNAWRAFNYTFLVPYSLDKEEELLALLGPWSDEEWAVQHALDIATQEVETLAGRDLVFAWFNVGTSRVRRFEYFDAASAFDTYFRLYSELPEDETRPWRMVWYQTGPYWAYYYTGRYGDVINLANTTLNAMKEPILEESFYWRALAKEALGDREGALADLQESVRLNPNFFAGWEQLRRIQGGG